MASATNTSATGLDPIVIVTSLGAVPAKEIINNIRQIPYTDDQLQMEEDHIGLRYAVVTKYYTSRIQFVHYDGALETLPQNMQDSVEGILVYFDAQNRDILKLIDVHLQYAKANGLQFLVLMCDKLFDDARLGMTHREVKQCTQMFIDIIELGRTRDADDDDEAAGTRTATLVATGDEDEDDKCDTGGESNSKVTDHHDPVGYAELMQVLQNNIWSNVDMDGVLSGKPKAYAGDEESAFRHELAEFLQLSSIDDGGGGGGGGGRGHNNEEMFADGDKQFVKEVADLMMAGNRTSDRPNRLNADMNALSLEETEPDPGETELLKFEKILNDVAAFRDNASSLSGNERFAYTQMFADAFDEMIGDGQTDDSGDELDGGAVKD